VNQLYMGKRVNSIDRVIVTRPRKPTIDEDYLEHVFFFFLDEEPRSEENSDLDGDEEVDEMEELIPRTSHHDR
jgi:hypothetical protein